MCLNLKQKHAVAIAEKTIIRLDCMGIGRQHPLPSEFVSREGADQHKEGGFWEVKVGKKAADDFEFVAGAEEDAGLTGMSGERFTVGDLSAMFKRTSCGGADGDDAISRL
jgi:hypothetical protein